ncbi:hypothetical protein DEIPH_ctg032orf0110 [Deinococcus phoenicis]|uniref:SpoVT-AbrB domain-containing protein n=1 Tax=Deinococcus phoenicis TaxID=1476583 RepID=A0A016QPN2_9DEIO|nr:AbrB/MazE/SpoVT family DNA-binding domain-containing protein [Deinococcus phoenicis]EYB67857.1 hypothetical protein DEIPH_ctg032orf0110 [Deinococcus phoenicis]
MMAHLELDRFGRVLLPKKLRDALGLQPGEQLEVEVEAGVLHLRPLTRPVQTIEHHGRLVLDGPGLISGDPVEDMREQRLDDLLGRW